MALNVVQKASEGDDSADISTEEMLDGLIRDSILDGKALLAQVKAGEGNLEDQARLVRQLRGLMRETLQLATRLRKMDLDQRYQAVSRARKMSRSERADLAFGLYAEMSPPERQQLQARQAAEDERT